MKDIDAFAKRVVEKASQVCGHTEKDWSLLASVRATTQPWATELGKLFGKLAYADPEVASMLASHNRGDREQAVAVWFERLASGSPGESFWAETALIGMYHAAASVPSEHVLAFMARLNSALYVKCIKSLPPPRGLEAYAAFQRVLGVATTVMMSAYESSIMDGMSQLGFNEKLMNRMRNVAVRKMIEEGRKAIPLMDWDESLSVGVAEVDRQHKALIALLNLLHSTSTSGKGNETLRKVFGDLAAYTVEHFGFEEKMLAQHGYPELQGHMDAHAKLTARVVQLREDFDTGRGMLGAGLFLFLRSWLNGHIRGSDRQYGRFLNAKGVY